METRVEVKTYKVDKICPRCSEGVMRPNGRVVTTYPLQYPHECTNPDCEYAETYDKTYSYIETKEIECDEK